MINELPKDFSSIATTFFEDYDNASRFAKDMEQNMKMLSGIDPLTTNQEVADYINDNNDQELLNGTEDAILQLGDKSAIELATQNMEALGVKKRVNPEISVYDYYTQNEIANKFTDDTYRVNFTNSKEDPSIYSTKYMIGSGKVYDALNSLKPNVTRLAMRYIGQPATSLAMSAVGGWLGAGTSDAVMAGWDASILGGTIYNTQKKYINRYHQLLNNNSLSLEQFTNRLDNLLTEIQTDVAPEYQYEIFKGIIEGPDIFADAGLGLTTLGIRIYAKPFEFLARTAKRMLPSASVGNSIKRMEMNEKLMEQIQKSVSNKVDETVVDETISAKVEAVKPKDAVEADVEMVKGIDKNKAVDRDLLQNSNNDSAIQDKPNKNKKMSQLEQKGEINLSSPEESVTIYHGKGVDNNPMTLEEAEKELKVIAGRKGLPEIGAVFPDNEPEYIAISTASKNSWGPEEAPAKAADVNPLGGEGTAMYGRGIVYASLVDDNESSRSIYVKRFQNQLESEYEQTIKDVTYPYAIDNPYFWFKNAKSSLTKEEADIVKEISENDYTKSLVDYMDFDDNYRGLKFETQVVASDEILKQNLANTEEQIKDVVKEYKEAPFTTVAKYFVDLVAERTMLQKILKYREKNPLPSALLYTHSIANPNKYPEKYLRYELVEKGDGKVSGRIYPESELVKPDNYSSHQNGLNFIKGIRRDALEYLYKERDRLEPIVRPIINEEPNTIFSDNRGEDLTKYLKYEEQIDRLATSGTTYINIEDWNDAMFYAAKERYGDISRKDFLDKYQRKMYTDAGIDGLLHSDTNIVIFNEDAIMPVNKLEKGLKRKSPVDIYEQMLYDNGHGIVSAGDGVGYYVVERHSKTDAKPMIIKNYKIVDEGE